MIRGDVLQTRTRRYPAIKPIPTRTRAVLIADTTEGALSRIAKSCDSRERVQIYGLFRQGAFAGQSPREAYFVKCDKETTTQTDINSGIVNILVGFAPLKPAEFVIIKISQIAGQDQA